MGECCAICKLTTVEGAWGNSRKPNVTKTRELLGDFEAISLKAPSI